MNESSPRAPRTEATAPGLEREAEGESHADAAHSDTESDDEGPAESQRLISRLIESAGREVFERVNKADPSVCAPCVNIICAFQYASKAIRTNGKASEALLIHHESLGDLFRCSSTCKMCDFLFRLLGIGGVERATSTILMSVQERMLERLQARDKDIFKALLDVVEVGLWEINPYHFMARLTGGVSEPEAPMYVRKSDKTIPPSHRRQQINILLQWAREMHIASSASPISSNTNHDAESIVRDALNPTMQNMARIYSILRGYYNIKEVRGWKEQPLQLEMECYSGSYPARVFTRKGKICYGSSHNPFNIFTGGLLAFTQLGRPVSHRGDDPKSFDLMKSWLSHCLLHHSECRWSSSKDDPILPSRIIDIGSSAKPIQLQVRANQKGRWKAKWRGKWVALSHRWGQESIIQTVKSNVQQLQENIEYSSLPATFQDAIVITRKLGIRYLWIDSLCIIQDSAEDWLKEAANMAGIYQHAHLTIAAAATSDSTGGIFLDRPWVSKSNPCELPIPLAGNEVGNLCFDVPFDAPVEKREINYLRDRGWCFQESRLSHRLLTFDALQMSYTCIRQGLIESRDTPFVLAREDRNKFLEQFQGGPRTLPTGDSVALRSKIISWYDLLYDYTRRDLTFSNDKLVAISGIANIVGACLQDSYAAGLWLNDMPRALLWSPYEEETLPNSLHKSSLPSIYRAPSWSWASIDGPISCFVCRERLPQAPIATVLEVSTTLVGPDPYGQVSAGHLKIRGPLKRATVSEKSQKWPEQPLLKFEGWSEGDMTHAIFDIQWLDEGSNVWCLQITKFYGLILVKSEMGEGLFERRGIFHLRTLMDAERTWFTSFDVEEVVIV